MGKGLIGLIVVVALVGVGYFYFLAPGAPTAPVDTGTVTTDDTAAPAEEAAGADETAADAATDAVESATGAATDAVESATEAATDAANAASEAVSNGAAALADVFSVDGFDFDAASEALQNSSLGELEKTTLGAALEGARDNPELLENVLTQIREALGL
ncbi:MAG: hypothetical protein AAFY77_04800 [Pseudomonadota bacterium]